MQKICITIPCYNEQVRLPVYDFLEFYESHPGVDYCFVNDGSTDKTALILQDIRNGREERVLVVDLSKNAGKAEAVRQGMFAALKWKQFHYIGFFDADFSTPLKDLDDILYYNRNNLSHELIMCSRVKRMGAVIERSFIRHYAGRAIATAISIALGLPVYDSQCGAKLFSAALVEKIFDRPFVSKWLFDVEILARIVELYGYDKSLSVVLEVPLNEWVDRGNSRLTTGAALKLPLELLKIRAAYRHALKKY